MRHGNLRILDRDVNYCNQLGHGVWFFCTSSYKETISNCVVKQKHHFKLRFVVTNSTFFFSLLSSPRLCGFFLYPTKKTKCISGFSEFNYKKWGRRDSFHWIFVCVHVFPMSLVKAYLHPDLSKVIVS